MVRRFLERGNLPLAAAAATWAAILYAAAAQVFHFPLVPDVYLVSLCALVLMFVARMKMGERSETMLIVVTLLASGVAPVLLASLLSKGIFAIFADILAVVLGVLLGLPSARTRRLRSRGFIIVILVWEVISAATLGYATLVQYSSDTEVHLFFAILLLVLTQYNVSFLYTSGNPRRRNT